MYTWGHEQILDDALALFRKPFDNAHAKPFDNAHAKPFDNALAKPFDAAELKSFLSFPDFPCGKMQASSAPELHPCSTAEVVLDVLAKPRDASMISQSHRGFYSLWHSMTMDPDKTVENTAKNVMEYVLICCKLAFEQRSMQWLAFALHVLMDAYSPAHVLRDHVYDDCVNRQSLLTYLAIHDTELSARDRQAVDSMKSIVSKVVRDVRAGVEPAQIVAASKSKDLVAFVVFDHLQRKSLGLEVKTRSAAPQRQRHPVMDFYFYPHQHGLFHPLNDRLSAVRRAGLYRECVQVVHKTLDLYRNTRLASVFVERMYNLISQNTFAVVKECRTNETGFDIERVLRPSTKTELLRRADGNVYVGKRFNILWTGADEFEIPVPRNVHTEKQYIAKRFIFTAVQPSDNNLMMMTYTYIEPGYPVSVEHAGRRCALPVLVKEDIKERARRRSPKTPSQTKGEQ
jgi:hypothetical protein